MTRTAVVTIVRGRHAHLQRHLIGVRAGLLRPEEHVVVSMGDPAIAGMVAEQGASGIHVLDQPVRDGEELPLAAARNAGAEAALAGGAEVLVFLDVDCIADPRLLERYTAAAANSGPAGLLCGPVAYLPPAGPGGYDLAQLSTLAAPHAARPAPADGTVQFGTDRRLFWSLSFAVTASTWRRVGGFCMEYTGYGGEDTDFAELAAQAGVGLYWVGGAVAYHQHHPVSAPPVEHLDAILRNAQLFHRRWGWWPMTGWLEQFAHLGLAEFDSGRGWLRRADRDEDGRVQLG